MAIYELTPEFNPASRNRHRVVYGTYTDDETGKESFLGGDALIVPPIKLTEKYIRNIKESTGLQVSEIMSSEEGTLFEFNIDMSDPQIEGSAEERAKAGFTMILKGIGLTATAGFRQNHTPDSTNPDKAA